MPDAHIYQVCFSLGGARLFMLPRSDYARRLLRAHCLVLFAVIRVHNGGVVRTRRRRFG